MFWWMILIIVVVFFLWAAFVLRKRSGNIGGPTARDERHRSTGGGDAIGGG